MGILRLCKFWEIFKRKIKNDQKIRPLKMKNYIRMTSYIKKIIKGLKFDFKRFKYEVNIDSIYNIKKVLNNNMNMYIIITMMHVNI